MKEKRTLLVCEDEIFTVGQDTFIESCTKNGNAVVFEDNEETGYFYAVDRNHELNILDALHIYNVANVVDKNKLSNIKILWSEDLTKAILSINSYYHAIFDFKEHAGYCRNAFPDAKNAWTLVKERLLTNELINKLLEE